MTAARIGVFGIGLATYWPQFEGLRERIEGYQARVEQRVRELGGEVISAGLVDTEQGARTAGDLFASKQVDLVLCHAVTYATSSTVLPVIQAAKTPALLLGLQPTPTLDYAEIDTAEWLANCAACCVPEIAGALTRARIPYDTVAGTIEHDPRAWEKIGAWVRAAGVARALRRARLGFMGHTYPGMLDLYSDFTAVHAQLGAHVEVLEIDDLAVRVDAASDDEVTAKIAEIRDTFSFADPSSDPLAGPVTDEQLDWSARVAVGLDRLAADFELDGLTYYYRGADNEAERVGAGMIVGNSLLTARGVITSGEGDLKTNIAQVLLDRLGAGGSFTEYYALDFSEEFVLMGHDGPGHIAISEGRPTLRALKLYHGKRGAGLSVELKVRYGPITIVGCTQTAEGRLKLIVAEGESIPGATFRIGNTNSRLKFSLAPAEFFEAWCEHGPTHHVALGVGHVARDVRAVARMLDLEYAQVG
ncbi:MAG TPA: L-fucose/L-arabinose isomerase family protein [Solirubrobacter sp.]|nr:L-fucose/L-arabinose isomerase family protein [Solirubrobacter sp.]